MLEILGAGKRGQSRFPPVKQEPEFSQHQWGLHFSTPATLAYPLLTNFQIPKVDNWWKIEGKKTRPPEESQWASPPIHRLAGDMSNAQARGPLSSCNHFNTHQNYFALASPALAASDLDTYLKTLSID